MARVPVAEALSEQYVEVVRAVQWMKTRRGRDLESEEAGC